MIEKIFSKAGVFPVSHRKLAPLSKLVHGLSVSTSLASLELYPSPKIRALVRSLLKSGISVATDVFGVTNNEKIFVRGFLVGRGNKNFKRSSPRARGRANRITKHSSNLKIIFSID